MTRLRFMMLAICVSFVAFSSLQAQSYSSAVGGRLGVPISATYKMFINNNGHAVEGIVGFRAYPGSTAINIGAAYEIHNAISSADNLYWYYGGGASILIYSYDTASSDQAGLSLAVQGYLGLDYSFDGAPINISIDWTPTIVVGGSGFGADSGALAVRYILD